MEYIKTIHKIYPTHTEIIEYLKAWTPTQERNESKKLRKLTLEQQQEIIIQRNVIRAKTKISDLIKCNTFEYFVTLTLNKTKVDRYNYEQVTQKLNIYLKHNLEKYILVPEKHKDGAFHFHLLADIPKTDLKHFKGRYYNIKSYKLGYSSAVKIQKGSEQILGNYIKKYITKDLIKSVPKHKKRYWASRNLLTPTVIYNYPIPSELTPSYQTEYLNIYSVDKCSNFSDSVAMSFDEDYSAAYGGTHQPNNKEKIYAKST